jgi:hypothetical protein
MHVGVTILPQQERSILRGEPFVSHPTRHAIRYPVSL